MTNREWLSTLTDEQLVKVLRTFSENHCYCCKAGYTPLADDDCGVCFDGQVEWLSQEHDNEGWEERSYRFCV